MSAASKDLSEIAMRLPDTVRMTPSAARRHSQRVRRLRLIVPALGAGVLATYVLSATPPTIDSSFLNEFKQIDTEAESLRLNQPRHVGYDLEGNLFEISAESALRDPGEEGLISLDRPLASRGLGNGDDVVMEAGSGLMDTASNRLDLMDRVEVQHRIAGSQFIFSTQAAEVDFDEKTITSAAGVHGEGDRGTVAADRLTVYQDEGRAVLEGNVKLKIEPAVPQDEDQSQ